MNKCEAMSTKQEQRSDSEHMGEPVGSLSVRYHRGCKSMTNTDFDYNGDLPEGVYELYITPQQRKPLTKERTWVGLTEEELFECSITCEPINFGYERAIEAKLKAKNERLEKNT